MIFRVCTYNMGANLGDYYNLCQYAKPDFTIESKEQQEALEATYQKSQHVAATLLMNQAEIFLLQEVYSEQRPLIVSLLKHHYQFIKLNENSDCVIALSKDFEEVKNHSTLLDNGDVAIATTIHRLSRQTLTFVSAHVPGCNLEERVDPLDAAQGDQYCMKIVEILGKIEHSSMQIIGIDMNANPEKWQPRFTPFEKEFQLVRTKAFTNVMPQSKTYNERELDFIFARFPPLTLGATLSSLWSKKIEKKVEIMSQPLGWKTDSNGSDHLPVLARFFLHS